MATALTATFQAGSTGAPARCLLQVTGAPTVAPLYSSDFTATVDGWTASLGAVSVGTGSPVAALRILASTPGTVATFSRTVTGLTIGQTYSLTLMARPTTSSISIGVSGIGNTYFRTPLGRQSLSYTFTATAASHVIQAQSDGNYLLDTVKVQRTSAWLGTTIRRTDANGTEVVVREQAPGQDAVGTTGSGVMTVTDYEHALTGPLVYTVTDGTGLALRAVVNGRLNVIPNPSFETDVAGWQANTAGTTIERDPTVAEAGVASMKCTLGAGSGYFVRTTQMAAGEDISGRPHGYRVRVRPSTTASFRASIRFLDSTLAVTTAYADGALVSCPAGQWTTLYVTGNAPASSWGYRPHIYRDDALAAGQVVNVEAARMTPEATFDPAEYWDGSTAGALWLGTAHAAASIIGAGPVAPAPGVWLALPATADPATPVAPGFAPVSMVTGYTETRESNGSVHTIIGREDPIANPGPLALRTGSFDAWCPDYAAAKTVRDLLEAGDVAQLRQPTFPGLDLYLVATDVQARPEQATDQQRWTVTVTYQEVVAP